MTWTAVFAGPYTGETEEEHDELMKFCREFKFERLGAFAYSEEDGRGLHSSTSKLNVSASRGIGGAFRGSFSGVWEVLGNIKGCIGCIVYKKRLKLS